MISTKTTFGKTSLENMVRGVNKVANAVKVTLGGIGKVCGALNHSTVKHHFNNHDENMKLIAYLNFYEHMDSLAKEVISSRQPTA